MCIGRKSSGVDKLRHRSFIAVTACNKTLPLARRYSDHATLSHRGQLRTALAVGIPTLSSAHAETPVGSNQVEIYFSVVQRKVLTPNDFHDLDAVEARLLEFQSLYEQHAKPFQWKFTREDLKCVLSKLSKDLQPTKSQPKAA